MAELFVNHRDIPQIHNTIQVTMYYTDFQGIGFEHIVIDDNNNFVGLYHNGTFYNISNHKTICDYFTSTYGVQFIRDERAQRDLFMPALLAAGVEFLNGGYRPNPSFPFSPSNNLESSITSAITFIQQRINSKFSNHAIETEKIRNMEKASLTKMLQVLYYLVQHGIWPPSGDPLYNSNRYYISQYHDGTLNHLYINILDSVGFEWSPERAQFMKSIDDLINYKDTYGNYEVKNIIDSKLYGFCSNIQRSYRNGALVQYKIEACSNIGYKLLSTEELEQRAEQSEEAKKLAFQDDVLKNAKRCRDEYAFATPPFPTKFMDKEGINLYPRWLRKYYKQVQIVLKGIVAGVYGDDDSTIESNEFIKALKEYGVWLDVGRGRTRDESTEASYITAINEKAYRGRMNTRDTPLCRGGNNLLDVRPDAVYTEEFDDWMQRDYAECDECCHNCETIRKEHRRLNILVIYAKEQGCTRINIIRFNVGTTKEADDQLVGAYVALRERIKNDSREGVFLYLIDYPNNHHHTIAYAQRVKPTPTTVEGVDEAEVLIPTTYDDVDKIHLPILDGMQLFYSSAEKAKLFGSLDNNMEEDEDDEEDGGGEEEDDEEVGGGEEEDNEADEGNVDEADEVTAEGAAGATTAETAGEDASTLVGRAVAKSFYDENGETKLYHGEVVREGIDNKGIKTVAQLGQVQFTRFVTIRVVVVHSVSSI